MSQGSDAAEQMVKETMIISETAAKLAGLGAKNLAVLLTLYLREGHQFKGETNLKKLLKEGKEIRVFCLDKDSLAEFKQHAKDYGIVYSALKQKNDDSRIVDVLVKAEDTPRVNRILEKMNYPLPNEEREQKADEQTKKSVSAARSEKASSEPSIGSAMPTKNDERRSVRERIDELEAFKSRAQEKYEVKTATKEIKREKRQER